ncbi:MATE family multidrug resistance protein [Elusimicrobium simillimum]
MQFTDRVFLSWYSPEALAACVPGGSLAFTFTALFMGIASYTGVFVAQYDGKKKRANISISLWQGIIVSVVSGVLIAGFTPLGFMLIDAFKHAPEVVAFEKTYFAILNSFGGFVILNSALAAFFIGRGKTTVPMAVSLVGNVVNLVLSYILIFGKFGMPQLGIGGAAVGTVMANVAMIACYSVFIFTQKNKKQFKVTRLAGFYKPAFLRLIRYGIPNGFGFFMDILSFSMFTFMVGHLDMMSLAASNIVMSMQSLSFMPILGLGLGVQVVVGRYMGMKRPDQVVEVVKNASKMGFVYAGVLGLLFFFIPRFFIGFFLPENAQNAEQITRLAMPLMNIVSMFVLFDCTYLIFGDAIRGAGDTKFHMIVMALCGWVLLVPGTYYIVYVLKKEVLTVWLWLTFYALITAIIMLARFLRGRWRRIDITAK